MSSRQTKLGPLHRWIAVLTLLVWTGAQALCQVHCSAGACQNESGETNCHPEQASESHHGDEHSPDHHDGSADVSCDTLKTALTGNTATQVLTPDCSLFYTLAPTVLALDTTAIEPAASFSRQTDRRDWMLTPAVYLGPAFRSLAPPVLL